jgi:DNA-binding GntR family transcriptional regulator
MLIGMLATLYDQAERYVALSVAYRDTPRDDVAEHKSLMDAALKRERSQLADLCRQHVDRTTEKVAASIAQYDHNEGARADG